MGAEITDRAVAQEKQRNGERTEKTEKLKRLIEDELSSPFDLRYSVSPVSPCPPHPPFPRTESCSTWRGGGGHRIDMSPRAWRWRNSMSIVLTDSGCSCWTQWPAPSTKCVPSMWVHAAC